MWIVALLIHGCSLPLWANPAGEQVISGGVTFERGLDGSLTISQGSDKAIIHWQDFSIGAGELTKFVQPSSTSAVLNRVIGGLPSSIHGTLQANGRVLLINPNGILVGPTGRIDVGGFLASTLDVSDGEFLGGGDMIFRGTSTASVVNQGTINAIGGDIFLFAQTVENSGTLNAPQGTVGMAAGTEILLAQAGDERVFVRAGGNGSVTNSGTVTAATAELKAHGNLYALAVNNTGVIRATSASKKGGRVFLTATGGGTVRNSGTVSARGSGGAGGEIRIDAGPSGKVENSGALDADAIVTPEVPATVDGSISGGATTSDGGTDPQAQATAAAGGQIVIMADQIDLLEGSMLRANGRFQGGTILVGGGFQGGDPKVINATKVNVSSGVTVQANGVTGGGRVIVWSDGDTTFAGNISARATGAEGQGGFVEVSGKQTLDYTGIADLRGAGAGSTGTLLLDPTDFTVGATQASTIVSNLASSSVVVSTSGAGAQPGNLTVSSAITYTSANSLTFLAHGSISFLSSVQNGGTGAVQAVAGWDGSTGFSGGSGIVSGAAVFNTIVNAGAYGMNGGSILIGTSSGTAPASVGSRFGATNTAGYSMNLRGSDTAVNANAQLGYREPVAASSFNISGPISVWLKGSLSVTGGSTSGTFAQVGQGGMDTTLQSNQPANDFSGDITIVAPTSVTLQAGTGIVAYAQIGNGGHGNQGTHSGNLSVTTGDLVIQASPSALEWAQLGNGGYGSDGDHNGNIAVTAQNVTLIGGLGSTNNGYAQIGHGGSLSDGNFSGAIVLSISGDLNLTGGSSAASMAHIGHGSVWTAILVTGTRQGNIDIRVGGETNLVNGSGDSSVWYIGHRSFSANPLSNAQVYFSTRTLDYSSGTTATLSTLNADFATKFIANLAGGAVSVASTGTGGLDVANAWTYSSANALTLLSTRNVTFGAGVQNSGTGALNIGAGWDNVTGRTLTPGSGTLMNFADIQALSSSYGNSNGAVVIGTGSQTTAVAVGSASGSTNVAGYGLLVQAGTTNANGYAVLGYQGTASGAFDLKLNGYFQALNKGTVSTTQLGHGTPVNSAGSVMIATAFTFSQPFSFAALARGDVLFFRSVQNASGSGAGTGGAVTAVGGWDGVTGMSGSSAIVNGATLFNTIVNAGAYGLNVGGIQIGATNSFTGASVGSRYGSTNIAGNGLGVRGSNSAGAVVAQIGFRGSTTTASFDINAPITVIMSGNALVEGGSVASAPAMIGHGGLDLALGVEPDGNWQGDITVRTGGFLNLLAGAGLRSSAQVGHGGSLNTGNYSGNITIQSGNMTLTGNGQQAYAQVGHGGYTTNGSYTGAINVTSTGTIALNGGAELDAYVQIGHGGIGTTVPDAITGKIALNVAGNLSLTGGISSAGARASIGHDASSGSRQGDIDIRVSGETSLVNGTGTSASWNIGHRTFSGSIPLFSNAQVFLSTGTLDYSITSVAGLTTLNTDFVTKLTANLAGGSVSVASTGEGGLMVTGAFSVGYSSNNALTILSTRDVQFAAGVHSQSGSGSLNVGAGWDAVTGLSVTPGTGPLLNFAAIQNSPSSYGNFNGTVFIGTGTQTGSVRVGTKDGSTNIVGHGLMIQASATSQFADAALGSGVGIPTGTFDLRLKSFFHILNRGAVAGAGFGNGGTGSSGGVYLSAPIEFTVPIDFAVLAAGTITIFSSVQNSSTTPGGNITLVAGWDGTTGMSAGLPVDFAAIRATPNSYGNNTRGVLMQDGALPIAVGSRFGATNVAGFGLNLGSQFRDSYSQLGYHEPPGATSFAIAGPINVVLKNFLAVSAGDQPGAFAQIGHGGLDGTPSNAPNNFSGDISITAPSSISVTAGSGDNAYAQIGNGGQSNNGSHSGVITLTTAGQIDVTAGTSGLAWAGIGNGGYNSDGNHSGSIIISALTIVMQGGAATADNYAQIGHGGAFSDGNFSDPIMIYLSGALQLIGGSSARSVAYIGHGTASSSGGSGTRQSTIDIRVAGRTSLVNGTGAGAVWTIGHRSSTAGAVSSAPVYFSTGQLDYSRFEFSSQTTLNNDFVTRFGLDLGSSNPVSIASTGIDGMVVNASLNYGSNGRLTLLSTRDLTFAAGVQNSQGGALNIAAGWDGITGVTPAPTGPPYVIITSPPNEVVDFGAIQALASSYGNSNGRVTIGTGSQTTSVAVGSLGGATNVLGNSLLIQASTTSSSGNAQLGYRTPGVTGAGVIDVRMRSYFHALNAGTLATTQVGHGQIVLPGEVVVTSPFTFAQSMTFGAAARGNVQILEGMLQNSSGTAGGNITLVAGWDGATGITASQPLNFSAILAASSSYGANSRSVNIGSGSQLGNVAVGSANGITTIAGYGLNIRSGIGSAQLGYRNAAGAAGTFQLNLTDHVTAWALASDVLIGHGIAGTAGNLTIASSFTFGNSTSFAALARRNINVFGGSIQNSSLVGGDVTLVAGWDGSTEASGLRAVVFSAIRAAAGSYGNLQGMVTIGSGSQTTAAMVGSANGRTNIAAYALSVDASTTSAAGIAQLGYRGVAGSTSAFDINLRSYFQALNRGTVSTTQIGNGTSVSAGGVVITSAFNFTQPFSFSALARRDVSFLGGQIQNSAGSGAGTGGPVTAIGGWNGTTGFAPGLPTNVNLVLDPAAYGLSGGSVVVGSLTGVTAGSSIGSRYAATTVAGADVRLYGNGAADATQRYAQIGFRVSGSSTGVDVAGNISVQAKANIQMLGLAFANSDIQIGHGGRGFVPGPGPSGNWSGDISIGTGVMLMGANGSNSGYAQVGHGGVGTSGTRTGSIRLYATHSFVDTLTMGSAARIGHGGADQVGNASGEIIVVLGHGLTMTSAGDSGTQIGHGGNRAKGDFSGYIQVNGILGRQAMNLNSQGGGGGYVQIGHGGDGAIGAFDGRISVENPYSDVVLTAGVDPAQIGHGGMHSSGAQTGEIIVQTFNLLLKGSGAGDGHAEIGHGDGLGLSTGTRKGEVVVSVAGETSLVGGTGSDPLWQIGHRTSTIGGVSDAAVWLTTRTLDGIDDDLLPATTAELDQGFATVFGRNVAGGDVKITTTELSGGIVNMGNWSYQASHDITFTSVHDITLKGSIVNTGGGSLMFITDDFNSSPPWLDPDARFINQAGQVSAGGGVTVFAPSIRTSVLGSLAHLPRQYGVWFGDPGAIIGGVNFKDGPPANDNKPFNGPPNSPPGPPFEPGKIFSPNSFPADLHALGALMGLPPEASFNFNFSGGVLFLNAANLNSESADYEGGNPPQNEGDGSLLHQNSSGVMGEEKKNDENKKEKGNGEQPGT